MTTKQKKTTKKIRNEDYVSISNRISLLVDDFMKAGFETVKHPFGDLLNNPAYQNMVLDAVKAHLDILNDRFLFHEKAKFYITTDKELALSMAPSSIDVENVFNASEGIRQVIHVFARDVLSNANVTRIKRHEVYDRILEVLRILCKDKFYKVFGKIEYLEGNCAKCTYSFTITSMIKHLTNPVVQVSFVTTQPKDPFSFEFIMAQPEALKEWMKNTKPK